MKQHISGFDYLRSTMAAFVVLWHMKGVGMSRIFSRDEFETHFFTISDFLNFHVFLLAVPTFMLVSCFFYIRNGVSIQRLAGRFGRLMALLCFWPLAFNLFRYGFAGVVSHLPGGFPETVRFVMTAGDTIFYFFVSLLFCTIVTHLIAKWKGSWQTTGFIFCLLLLPLSSYISPRIPFPHLSAYWNPMNFLVYPFLAALISRHESRFRERKILIMIVAIALMATCSVIEWKFIAHKAFFATESFGIPAYTRASVVFGAIALFTLSCTQRLESNPQIRFASKFSLAVFCLHPFLIDSAKSTASAAFGDTVAASCISPVLVIAGSYVLAVVLKRYFFQERLLV